MTFIASVIGKEGIAVIADSLVTSSKPIISLEDFKAYLSKKVKDDPDTSDKLVNIELDEVIDLFNMKPSHTKNYEQKLFKFDNFTAITTAGNAVINEKRIRELIDLHVIENSRETAYNYFELDKNINAFKAFITNEIKEHLRSADLTSSTTFIFSHFNTEKNEKRLIKLRTNKASKKDLLNDKFDYFQKENYVKQKVVCDGQHRISEQILYGGIDSTFSTISILLEKFKSDFKINDSSLADDYLTECLRHCVLENDEIEFKINELTDLSLQQAVDLATLLMKIEISFQNFTKNIPTVGGVIKIATISKEGFKNIIGHEIIKPKMF